MVRRHRYILLTKRPARAAQWWSRWCDVQEVEPRLARGPTGRRRMYADLLESMGEPPAGAAYPLYDWMEGLRWWPAHPWPWDHCWLGWSAWDQASFDAGWSALRPLAEQGWRVWCSLEPLLGPVDIEVALSVVDRHGEPSGPRCCPDGSPMLSGVIAGCESGPGRRPALADWFRAIRDQCAEAGVPFALKQAERGGKVIERPLLDGKEHWDLPWIDKSGD